MSGAARSGQPGSTSGPADRTAGRAAAPPATGAGDSASAPGGPVERAGDSAPVPGGAVERPGGSASAPGRSGGAVTRPATAAGPVAGGRGRALAERGLQVGGAVTGVLAGVVTAGYEGFLSPLRWGGVRAPLAPVLAVLVNPLLVWFTYRVTGSRGLALLPGLAWCLVLVTAAVGTREGDIMLADNNWMAILLMLAGALSWAVAAAVLVIRPRPPSPAPGPPATGPRSGRRPG